MSCLRSRKSLMSFSEYLEATLRPHLQGAEYPFLHNIYCLGNRQENRCQKVPDLRSGNPLHGLLDLLPQYSTKTVERSDN